MKYIDALKKYNEGKDKWCSPKKGSADYLEILRMMRMSKSKSESKGISHSFRSKSSSPNAPRSNDYQIVENNPEIYLINAVGDGDCFINAIFDYCLYTGALDGIYNRLKSIEVLIMSISKYEEGVKKAKALFKGFSIKKYDANATANITNKSLVKTDSRDVPSKYNKLSKRLTYFTHSRYSSVAYDKERKAFSKSMKYMQVLYIYTYGKNVFLNRLTRYMDIAISTEGVEVLDWDSTLIHYVKKKYYHKTSGELKKPIDVRILLDEYMKIYAETKGYFTGDDQIFIFRKILFKRMKAIPRFWLNYETIQSVSNITKIVKFRAAGTNKFIEKDGDTYHYISLLRDGEHYLLFVAKSLLVKNKKPKNQLQRGGWDKRGTEFNTYMSGLNIENLLVFEKYILKGLLENINIKFNKKFKELNETIAYIRTLNKEELKDDFNYDLPKFSVVPSGTTFYRRQKTESFDSVNRPIWLDYTGTMSLNPFIFLIESCNIYTMRCPSTLISSALEYRSGIQFKACCGGVILSPCEAKTIIGDSIFFKSTRSPSKIASPLASLLPINKFSTIQRISASVMKQKPPHQRSNSMNRSASVST